MNKLTATRLDNKIGVMCLSNRVSIRENTVEATEYVNTQTGEDMGFRVSVFNKETGELVASSRLIHTSPLGLLASIEIRRTIRKAKPARF